MSGAGLKPRDIVEMMPTDTRNPDLGTEWSWVAEGTKRARWAREGRRGAVSQSVSAKFEESSRPTSESIFVKVGESSQFVRLAAAPVAVADLVHQNPPHVPNSRSTPISNVFSATTAGQPASKTAATPMMTHTHRPVPISSVLPPVSPTQLSQHAPKISVTGKPWRDTTADTLLAIAPTQVDRKTAVGVVITAGNQISFQQSPPSAHPSLTAYRRVQAQRGAA
jgi:hypothetical protein